MDSNQYAPPMAHVDDPLPEEGVGELAFFSSKGRIGRLRYLAWGFAATWLYYIVIAVLTPILRDAAVVAIASWVLWVPLLVFSVLIGIKRCHDINISGWWSLTLILPVIVLAWIFWPGSKGANRFGPPPPPNNWGVRILGLLMPVMMIGIIAAVAIPAYQQYTIKAKAARQQNAPVNR